MPQEVRIWEIVKNSRLCEYQQSSIGLESRIEEWLEQDISILSNELLVIGRQVKTDFGGIIDLLCINQTGDLVIVELKRDKTPREVTAQVLDYASWINNLSASTIIRIADDYLDGQESLERIFREHFNQDLPDTLNNEHRMMIVASKIDGDSERIIRYLSDKHGVNINAVTFNYFKGQDDNELLARVFLIEPSQVEYQTRTKSSSKRLPNLTYEELEETAKDRRVAELYRRLVDGLQQHFQRHTTRSSIGFSANMGGSQRTIISVFPSRSTKQDGLFFQLFSDRFQELLELSEDEAETLLPDRREPPEAWQSGDIASFFGNKEQIDHFLDRINKEQE